MRLHLRAPFALLALICSACVEPTSDETSDELGTESDTDSETDSTETGMEPPPGCECIIDDEFDGGVQTPSSPTCGDALCPMIEVGDEDMVMNPEAVDCALMALRDRTPGIVTWYYSMNIGQYTDTGYLLILEDGRAVQRWWGDEDKSYTIGDAELGELQAAAYFDGCLAETEAIMRYYCVRADLVSVDGVCDEGISF